MPFPLKMSCSLQECTLLVNFFYENCGSALEALRRFQASKNTHIGAMAESRILPELLKDRILHHTFNISKNLLCTTVKHVAILQFQAVLGNNG